MLTSRLVASLVMLVVSSTGPARADDFYRDKNLTAIVGYAAGGGFDLYARLLARHIGRHLPGNPKTIVMNLPGAGTLTSLQYLNLNAPKDGTAINMFDWAQIGNSRLTPDKVKFDFRKFGWIGSMAEDLGLCYVSHKLDVKSIEDLRHRRNIHMGSTNVGTGTNTQVKILKSIFKLDVVPVTGYRSGAEKRIAVERGELDGDCGSWSSLPADWISERKIRPLVRFGDTAGSDMPPSVPAAEAIAPTERDRAIIRVLTASAALGKPLVAHMSAPPERLALLRAALTATMADPLFLADAEKQRLIITPKSYEEAMGILDEVYAMPEDIISAARTAVLE